MSEYEPKVGDRVRITYEGVVTKRTGYTFYLDDSDQTRHFTDNAASVSIEKIRDPLPATPGSVIFWLNSFCHLREDGDWVDDNGDSSKSKVVQGHHYKVIFDAGAV